MKFIVDECTGPGVARWLYNKNYDVFSVYEQARGMGDEYILKKAVIENRILITNDRDFGEMVFREKKPHKGIVFLRLEDERTVNKIKFLSLLLNKFSEQLTDNFVVVTEKNVRIVRL